MWAQSPGQNSNVYAYEDISRDNTGTSTLTAANLDPADPTGQTKGNKGLNRCRLAYITVDTGALRYRVDGGTPVTAGGSGHLVNAGDPPLILTDYNQMKNFKCIADSATASKIRVTYMR